VLQISGGNMAAVMIFKTVQSVDIDQVFAKLPSNLQVDTPFTASASISTGNGHNDISWVTGHSTCEMPKSTFWQSLNILASIPDTERSA
jgi:hypothetical protein